MWNEWFVYDESSPSCLRWRQGSGPVSGGDCAGTIGGQLYYRVQLHKKIYTVHKIIWEMFNTEIGYGFEIDHIDLNKQNNKLKNLRKVTKSVNCRNRHMRSDSTSGISNVRRRSRRGFDSWVGRFVDGVGKRITKEFSVAKYGEQGAKDLALSAVAAGRSDALNNYTELHGSKGKS